jgi:adenylylsulfate kinase
MQNKSVLKVLVMGLPGSGKTTLSKKLAVLIKGVWLNADKIREEYNDWDFSPEGRVRQANRMRDIAKKFTEEKKNVVADFICPTLITRNNFNPDYVVWMNTIQEGRFEDTNKMFEKPESDEVDYIVQTKNADKYLNEICENIKKKFKLL